MLTKRMLINNKSAARFATAVLEGYQFCFSGFSDIWKGSTANIVPKANVSFIHNHRVSWSILQNHVYGVVYTMDVADVEKLDKQEIGYDAIEVQVKLDPKPKEEENGIITCRTYVQKDTYRSSVTNEPSRLYKMVILKGGEEHRLPARYMESVIEKWPDNGRTDCGPANLSLWEFDENKDGTKDRWLNKIHD